MADTIVVTDGSASYAADVRETLDHRGDTFARVHVPATGVEQWVEMPDEPATPSAVLVCEDCGREPHPEPDKRGPLRKEHACTHDGSARLLKRIHEAKRPSHEPRIEQRAA